LELKHDELLFLVLSTNLVIAETNIERFISC
jgi:hypothetical protein